MNIYHLIGFLFLYVMVSTESLKLFRGMAYIASLFNKNIKYPNYLQRLLKNISKKDLMILIGFYLLYIIATFIILICFEEEFTKLTETILISFGISLYFIFNAIYFFYLRFRKLFIISIIILIYVNFLLLTNILKI